MVDSVALSVFDDREDAEGEWETGRGYGSSSSYSDNCCMGERGIK